jgi:hypothetical protein
MGFRPQAITPPKEAQVHRAGGAGIHDLFCPAGCLIVKVAVP